MASFDENGKYIKTNWKAGDKITATKLNKIEESIEAVNDNDISRHVEADARLDALEAKDVAHDKELTNIKNTIADNKAAAELGDYDINSRMQFLEEELNEGIEEVHNVASTVDGKIAQAEANMNNIASTVDGKIAAAETNMQNQVNQGKADMEAMVAEVEGELDNIVYNIFIDNDVLNSDNSLSIQAQIDEGVSKGRSNFLINTSNNDNYVFIESTIMLPSNITIEGNNTTFKAKAYKDVGKYTTCIFKSDNGDNIKLKNLTLDAGCNVGGFQQVYDLSQISNLLCFNHSSNVVLENISFINFAGNTASTIAEHYEWAMVCFKQCTNVKVLDCKFTQSDTEGLDFYRCNNVEVNRFYSYNSYAATPIHFWYCDGVKLLNSEIYEDVDKDESGSTINCTSSNVLVQGNKIIGGTSFDIGNEGDENYIAENINITNNYFNTCINSITDPVSTFINKNVRITNNVFDCSGYNYGINVGNAENVIIQNNTINGANSAYRCFGSSQKNVIIQNNVITETNAAINFYIEGTIDNIYIMNNIITTIPVGDQNPLLSNYSCLVFKCATDDIICKNIYFTDNICTSEGSMIMMHEFANSFVDNMIVRNNVLTDDKICQRGIRLRRVNNAEVVGNKLRNIDGSNGCFFSEVNNLKIEDNEMFIFNDVSNYPWLLNEDCGGVITFHNNICHSSDSSRHIRFKYTTNENYTIASPTNYPDAYADGFKPYFRGETKHRPTYQLKTGQTYYDTTLKKLLVYDGTNWIDNAGNIV